MATLSGAPLFATEDSLSSREQSTAERMLGEVSGQKQQWEASGCADRVDLLSELTESLRHSAVDWVAACCNAKGHLLNTPASGEEWLTGPCIVARNIRLLRESLVQISDHGTPRLPAKCRVRSTGQVVAPVFPTGLFDGLLFPGFAAEVWMEPDVTIESLPQTMAVAYQNSTQAKLSVVLGAGNVSSIGPMDVFYKLFVENELVILKMNPVNAYLTETFERAFRPLIDRNLLRVVEGGAAVGKFLCEHELVETIHITGSDKTHDAIVFGPPPEGHQRKERCEPINARPITSELGNVSPVIVVPGAWTTADIRFQAQNVVSMLANNAGFNCNSARVLVLAQQWNQRETFLAAIEEAFRQTPTRRAYYPGARQRHEAFTSGRQQVSQIGSAQADELPWTLVRNLDPNDPDEICFSTEPFCSVMGETSLAADSVADYITRATEFSNDRLWGTLCATVLVHPKTLGDEATRHRFDQMIADLRFGTVAINQWAGINFGLGSTTWGAFPGHTLQDIRSGKGVVHNTYMFDRPQKTVLRGPFRPFPKPVWFANHKKTHRVGPALFQFESAPAWWRLPLVATHALG